MNTEQLVQWIKELIEEGLEYKFYKSREWLELRTRIFEEAHFECCICKGKGRISKAVIVHHVNHLKDYPQWALSEWVINEKGEHIRNLIPVCFMCHETVCHPEKFEKAQARLDKKRKKNEISPERWD